MWKSSAAVYYCQCNPKNRKNGERGYNKTMFSFCPSLTRVTEFWMSLVVQSSDCYIYTATKCLEGNGLRIRLQTTFTNAACQSGFNNAACQSGFNNAACQSDFTNATCQSGCKQLSPMQSGCKLFHQRNMPIGFQVP